MLGWKVEILAAGCVGEALCLGNARQSAGTECRFPSYMWKSGGWVGGGWGL